MGENEGWAELGEPLPNGLLPGSGSVMRALDADRWVKAEDRTAELIACIQPNQLSEGRRNAVADYVQRLIMKCFPCQVCTFGSVPLKTYLPDGDIDLTACSQNQNLKDSWANQVRDMLEKEEKNENAEFHVKEVQYIQAEVKIIKCLVENIVVDISFNQVGGLCTLCFLDEVDNLINQNHLFKRSIILIKAWCYYESRILGAHHGLISTYALETLVLYIFHLFNNSFHGPLEVLYRFLEFFSNFDWDNFCVSLWGPVPISSLPDVTAEPPRKDSGRLLLSKLFLDACSSVYAVFPAGQENNGMPFVSKHFNVIDPLRVNNNLGRSVSKGNFFRVRSAFAFGAKRLARLLDCPKENIIYEVNQFFMNTWDRHGSGNRPDAPRLSTPNIPHEYRNSNNNSSGKKVKEESAASSRVKPITSALSVASRTHELKYQFNVNSLRLSDQNGGDPVSGQVEIKDMIQRDLKADNLIDETQGRLLLARTRSSPELTESYTGVSSKLHHKRQSVAAGAHATYSRLDSSNRRKNLGSESLGIVEENSSGRNVASRQILDVADLGIDALSEEFLATSAAQIMQQEEQDLVNMMASASLQGFNGQVHVPSNLTSGHLTYSIPPDVLASMGYSLRNMPGLAPTNIQLMDPSLSHLQFPHTLVSPHLPHHFHGIGLNPSEDSIDRSSEFFSHVEINSVEADNDYLQEQDACFDPENGKFDTLQSEMKYVPTPSRVSGSQSGKRVPQKHLKEKRGVMKENVDSYPVQDIMSSEIHVQERSRLSSAAHINALRSRTSSESSWDGLSVKAPRSAKEKRGKKSLSTDLTSNHGKGNFMSENVSIDIDNDDQECVSLLNVGTEVQVPRHHMPGFEAAHTSGSDSMIPFAPMLINPGSRQRTGDNSGLIAFYPTGPPIPFLTMLPVYNMPPETATSDETFDQSEDRNTTSSFKGTSIVVTSEEKKPDILNSDFASHWQNLQFGRVCQNPRYQGPLVYPLPFMVPPAYVQGQVPCDSPSRPLSANANIYSQLVTNYGNHVVPIAPSNRHLNVYQSYNDDMPRFHSGTGTYLPIPKVSVRECHSSSGRRGNYNPDRNDSFGDRNDNWTGNSKSRASGRSHNRSHTDKSNSRTDRFNNNEGRGDRLWNNSNRHNPIPPHQSQSGPLPSNSNQIGPQNVAYSMYNLGATNPTGVSNGPPLVMIYHPFDHNPNYGSHGEQLEFGSLGPVGFPGINEQSHVTDGTRARALEEHRFHGNSGRRTPDHPSSPQNQRRL